MNDHNALPIEPIDLTIPNVPTVEEQIEQIDLIFEYLYLENDGETDV